MTYEFHPEAEQEFIEAAAYYEQNVTGLGERFGNEVRRAIERLREYPEIDSPIDTHLRRIV
jgi:toxin ParE1/3/4